MNNKYTVAELNSLLTARGRIKLSGYSRLQATKSFSKKVFDGFMNNLFKTKEAISNAVIGGARSLENRVNNFIDPDIKQNELNQRINRLNDRADQVADAYKYVQTTNDKIQNKAYILEDYEKFIMKCENKICRYETRGLNRFSLPKLAFQQIKRNVKDKMSVLRQSIVDKKDAFIESVENKKDEIRQSIADNNMAIKRTVVNGKDKVTNTIGNGINNGVNKVINGIEGRIDTLDYRNALQLLKKEAQIIRIINDLKEKNPRAYIMALEELNNLQVSNRDAYNQQPRNDSYYEDQNDFDFHNSYQQSRNREDLDDYIYDVTPRSSR